MRRFLSVVFALLVTFPAAASAGRAIAVPVTELRLWQAEESSNWPVPGGIFRYDSRAVPTASAGPQHCPGASSDFYNYDRIVRSVRGQFTAKLRDYESGLNLDYFGARYYAGTLGRFTSPDQPLLDQDPLDPQSWNLYSYVRNNPLRYIDPTGQKIELLGDEEERKRQIEALQSVLSDESASYLYQQDVTVTNESGEEETQYFVGIREEGPNGEGPSAFRNAGLAEGFLGSVVDSSETVQMGLVSPGTTVNFDQGSATLGAFSPGATSLINGGVSVRAVNLSGSSFGSLPAELMSNNKSGNVNLGLVLFHELGHAAYGIGSVLTAPGRGVSNQIGVSFENAARRARNPSAPIRLRHNLRR